MAKYHFIGEKFEKEGKDLPPNRISVEYGKFDYAKFGLFVSSEYFQNNKRFMKIGNCEGSLMAIDTLRDTSINPINKLHIGELMIRRPHAESYEEKGEKGVRVDLSQFDTHYAKQELRALEEWKNPEHREKLRAEYATYNWYCVPFRVKQLNISDQGLEAKIDKVKDRISWLRTPPRRDTRRFVYEKAKVIESKSYTMVELMNFESQAYEIQRKSLIEKEKLTKNYLKRPKLIVNRDIVLLAEEINRNLSSIFDFICPKIDVAKARNYWQNVAEWGSL